MELILNNLPIYLGAINIITFAVFGYDKKQAEWRNWRVPESQLLLITFIGGTAGAIIGMQYFKHKRKKASFMLKFSAVMILQVILGFVYLVQSA